MEQKHQQESLASPDRGSFLKEMQYGHSFPLMMSVE